MAHNNLSEEQQSRLVESSPDVSVEKTPDDPLLQLTPAADMLIGASIGGHYTILELIGEGGLGRVYKASHLLLNRTVAIKMLLPHLLDERTVRRFQQEAQAATELRHEHICAVFELGINDSRPFLVMEYLHGISLSELLLQQGRLSQQQAIEISIQLCEALAHAHSRGVIHRDIKPANVILVQDSTGELSVKLVDFGIAKVVRKEDGKDLTKTGEVFGTPKYMSPEQIEGRRVEASSDIYSLGCVMHEMLTGEAPFDGESAISLAVKHLSDEPPEIGADCADRWLSQVVLKTLQKNPGNRYKAVSELKNALEEKIAPATVKREGLSKRRSSSKLMALVSVLALAACAVFAVSTTIGNKSSNTGASLTGPEAEKALKAVQLEKVIANLTDGINAHPDDDYWYIVRGMKYRDAGMFDKSLEDLNTAVRLKPRNGKGYRERALTLVELKKFGESIRDHTKAIELEPRFADAYVGRARGYGGLGQWQKAVDDCTTAIGINPLNPMAYCNRGSAYHHLGNYEKAIADATTAISLNPMDDSRALMVRARAAEQLGRFKISVDDLSCLLAKNPEDYKRMLERSSAYYHMGKFNEALKDAELAEKINRTDVIVNLVKAEALTGLDRYALAFAELDNAAKNDEKKLFGTQVERLRGDICLKQGRKVEALKYYNESLKLWASNPEALKGKALAEKP